MKKNPETEMDWSNLKQWEIPFGLNGLNGFKLLPTSKPS